MMGPIKKPAFSLDIQSCSGCKTCMVACKDKNDLAAGIRWRRVVEYVGGDWVRLPDGTFRQNVFGYYISVSCNHCSDPVCVEGCPTGAMNKDENGIVSVDHSLCMGCRYCEWSCPYSAPQYYEGIGQMTKCDMCRDELEQGGLPACVAACPTRALGLVEIGETPNEVSGHTNVAPLPEEEYTSPNFVVNPSRTCQPVGSEAGKIVNPEEIKDA